MDININDKNTPALPSRLISKLIFGITDAIIDTLQSKLL